MANPFSISNYSSSGGQNPMSVGYKPPTTQQNTQSKFLPSLLSILSNVSGSFKGMLGNAGNSFNNLSQGFTNWQNTNNPNRYTPTSDSPQKTSNDEELLPKDFLGLPERWDTLPEIDTQFNWPPPPGALDGSPENQQSSNMLAPQHGERNNLLQELMQQQQTNETGGFMGNAFKNHGGAY